MATTITLRSEGTGPIAVTDVDVRLPEETFSVLGVPNFAGGPNPDQTIVPSLRQFGGAVMTIRANLPDPVVPVLDVAETARRIEAWKEAAKTRLVDSFTFEATDFTLTVEFAPGDRPTLETLVRDWDFIDDIVLGLLPVINGEPFDLGDGAGGGTNLNDALEGSDGDDLIEALDGNDYVQGGDGADTIEGGDGRDNLFGGAGDDRVYGGADNDELYSSSGAATLYGGGGNDRLDATEGPATLKGGAGDDWFNIQDGGGVMLGGAGNDTLGATFGEYRMDGGGGNDLIYGGFGVSTLTGGAGNDTMSAGAALDAVGHGDALFGGGGDDFLAGSWSDDSLTGGDGADTFSFNQSDGTADGYQFGTDAITDFSTRDGDKLVLYGFDLGARAATTAFSRSGAVLEFDGFGVIEITFDGRTTERAFYRSIDAIDL